MRWKASKILLLAGLTGIAFVGGVTPALAHAHKVSARPEPRHAAVGKAAAKSSSKRGTHAETAAPALTHAEKARAGKAKLKLAAKHVAPEPARRGKKGRAASALDARAARDARENAKTRPIAPPRHSDEPIAEAAPAPEPAQLLPEIHVTHNRKQHLQTAPPDTPETDAPVSALPRKATPADFLTEAAAESAPAAEAALLPPPSKPVPVIAVVRKAAVKATVPVVKAPAEKELVARLPEPPPVIMQALYNKHGKLIVPAALKGSHDILIHQNLMADHDGLDRIQDDEDLDHMRESKLLVALPQNAGIRVDERLPANRRYSRPWTASFLTSLARAHYERFHTALQVNSAVRTVQFQQRLMRSNGNAAPAEGETASPHLTGQAVDIAKKGLSLTEIAWLRGYLLPLVQEGKVDVEEEFQQACFHVSVYRKYMPQAAPPRTITPHRSTASALAAAVR